MQDNRDHDGDRGGSATTAVTDDTAAGQAGQQAPEAGAGPGPGVPGGGVHCLSKIAAVTAAVALIGGAGFGVFAAAGGLDHAPPPPSSAIPRPPKANATFVEDDDGAGQDSQDNILARVAPALVQIATPGSCPARRPAARWSTCPARSSASTWPAAGPARTSSATPSRSTPPWLSPGRSTAAGSVGPAAGPATARRPARTAPCRLIATPHQSLTWTRRPGYRQAASGPAGVAVIGQRP